MEHLKAHHLSQENRIIQKLIIQRILFGTNGQRLAVDGQLLNYKAFLKFILLARTYLPLGSIQEPH